MKIRSYAEGDYQFTHDLHQRNMITYIDRYWGGWDSDIYKRDVRPENTWIIEHDGQRAGFFVLSFKPKAQIKNIQIDSIFRNIGLGSKAVKHCETESSNRGFKYLYLEVFLDNPAQHLYKRLGYVTYGEAESHFMMKKELKE